MKKKAVRLYSNKISIMFFGTFSPFFIMKFERKNLIFSIEKFSFENFLISFENFFFSVIFLFSILNKKISFSFSQESQCKKQIKSKVFSAKNLKFSNDFFSFNVDNKIILKFLFKKLLMNFLLFFY